MEIISHNIPTKYKENLLKKKLFLLILLGLIIISSLFSLSKGSLEISLFDVMRAIFGGEENRAAIMNIRLPRLLTALLVGAILGLTGAVLQCVLKNPLASSSTLGVSQGASFGAALGIVIFGAGVINPSSSATAISINNPYIVTICAFLGGSISVLVIILIKRFRRDIGASGLILAGVALSSLFSGGISLLQYFADDTQIGAIVFWTFGNLSKGSWSEIFALLAVFLVIFVYFIANRWNYNAMILGQKSAQSLGVNSGKVMIFGLVFSCLGASIATSFVGTISFIGLVAPHLVEKFVGKDFRFLLIASALGGALLLLWADILARLLIAPVNLPVGAISSFLGAPMFLYLLFKGGKSHD